MYEIQTEDFYKDISADVKRRFDTSHYPPDHPSGIPSGLNKKVIDIFKDEACGKVIYEFLGLRAKLYSYKILRAKRAKNVRIWLVVLGFNATLTAMVISWRSVTHMCFLAFSHHY